MGEPRAGGEREQDDPAHPRVRRLGGAARGRGARPGRRHRRPGPRARGRRRPAPREAEVLADAVTSSCPTCAATGLAGGAAGRDRGLRARPRPGARGASRPRSSVSRSAASSCAISGGSCRALLPTLCSSTPRSSWGRWPAWAAGEAERRGIAVEEAALEPYLVRGEVALVETLARHPLSSELDGPGLERLAEAVLACDAETLRRRRCRSSAALRRRRVRRGPARS